MAWGKKDFQEEFGMSREDFDARMKEASESKAGREADAARIAALEARGTELDSLKSELASLKAPRQEQQRQEPTNFFEDPDKAMGERMAPLAGVAVRSAARMEEMIARNKFQKDFSRWGKEIDELMAKEQDSLKANPVFWENAINMIRGRHAAEIEESAQKGQFYFTEQPGGGTVGGNNDAPESKLSAEELRSAQRLGMTPKEFVQNQAEVYELYGHGKHIKGDSIVH